MTEPHRDLADADRVEEFKPLTALEAQAWRNRQPALSPWRVLFLQAVAGLALVAVLALWSGLSGVVVSAAWGVVSVWLPALVFARALSRQMGRRQPGSALAGLLVWEFVKVVLTVALLAAAPKVVAELNWPALLAGFVLTLKMYWLAMVLHGKRVRGPKF